MVDGRVEWLEKGLREQIKGYVKLITDNRRRAFALKLAVAILGAFTTVAIGLQSSAITGAAAKPLVSAVALVFSASITVLSTWDSFFDHRWQWVKYAATLDELYCISADLGFKRASGEPIPSAFLDDLHARFQATLRDTNRAWAEKLEKDDTPPTGGARS